MKKKKGSVLKTIVSMTLLAGIIVFAYFYMANNISNSSEKSKTPNTEVEKLLAKDLVSSYPGTPKEVIKLYIRINQSFYNESLKSKQFDSMLDQIRLLMDDKMLANNPLETHKDSLESLVKKSKKKKSRFVAYIVEDNSDVVYNTIDGEEHATINASYTVRESGDYEKTYVQFIMKKNKDNQWKILGWKVTDPKEMEEE